MATRKVRLWLRVAAARHSVAGVVFFDAIAAFYSVIRQIALGLPATEEALAWLLDRLDLAPEAQQAVRDRLRQPAAVSALALPPFNLALMQEMHSST
eukprot:6759716-Lingulodinium_polyedra.AAC.1